MSGPADSFGNETAALRNVRRLGADDHLHEYTGVLAATDERVHVLTLAPTLADIDAAVDAFTQVSDQWYNASANANILGIRERDTDPRPWIAVPDRAETLATIQPDLSPAAVETIITETADALRTLGLYNTVHGHLSPDDIYVTGSDGDPAELTVEVGGFGLEAAIRAAVDEYEPTAYTAPELVDDPDTRDQHTDVYGLGAVTYFALTGQAPVAGADLEEAVREGPAVPPSPFVDALPGTLDDVVMRALSPRPDDRYDSPYAFNRAFLSTFAPDDIRPDDADETGDDGEEHGGDGDTADDTPRSSSDDATASDDDVTDSSGTARTNTTRRAALGLLGLGAVGGAGWLLWRRPLGASTTAQTAAGPSDRTAAALPGEPSASISVTPAEPAVGETVTFSATASTTGAGVTVDTYEWAVGDQSALSEGADTRTYSFSQSGERTVRLRITDSRGRTATAATTLTVGSGIGGAPMFQYDAANTGASPDETGPRTSVTEQWSYETGGRVRTSPAVVDGTVYVGSDDESVYALSAADGTERWSYRTGAELVSSPAVVDGTVFIGGADGSMYALSTADGTEQWSAALGSELFSSPAVVGDTVYVGGGSSVYALSAADGSVQWSRRTRRPVPSSPAVADGTVYVGIGASLYALSAADGTEQWANETGTSLFSSPAVVGGTVYAKNGDSLYALSATDGTEQWSTDSEVITPPAVTGGSVYVGSANRVYASSAGDGTEQWTYTTGEPVSPPVVVDETVYVRSGDTVYALSAEDGTERWSYQLDSRLLSPPTVVDGIVYTGGRDGDVYAVSDQ